MTEPVIPKATDPADLVPYAGARDPHSPANRRIEAWTEMQAEAAARRTSFLVGMALEALTRRGNPVGPLPEAFEVSGREDDFTGTRGSPRSWQLVEPLASVVAEGRKRYVAGASMSALGTWSKSTAAGGFTPKGRVMDASWWRSTLTNPKYAGYHVPTVYRGFRPGIETPKRPRRTTRSELIPCKLPPLWSIEDHSALLGEIERRAQRTLGSRAPGKRQLAQARGSAILGGQCRGAANPEADR